MKHRGWKHHRKHGGHKLPVRTSRTEQSGKPGERKTDMTLATFKTFSADKMDVEELVALSAFGRSLKAEFEELNLEVPEFVDLQLKSLRREVRGRMADRLESEKRRIKAQLDGLKTTAERKAELRKQLDSVENQLAEA